VTQRIVDAFEPVEIEKHHRDAIAPSKRLFHLVLEQDAIGQIGERVVPGHVDDLGLGLAAFGDIFIGRDPAAVRGRAVQTGDDAAIVEIVKMRLGRPLSQELGLLAQELFDVLAGMIMDADAGCEHVLIADAGFDLIGRKLENLQEAPVKDFQPVLCIVKAETLRHVFQGGIEQQVGLAQRPFQLLEPADVTAQHDDIIGIDDDNAFLRTLKRVGEPRLRTATLLDFTVHHRLDVVAHHSHRGEQRTELIGAAARHRDVEFDSASTVPAMLNCMSCATVPRAFCR